MYDVFDEYLNRDTWHTPDSLEDNVFHRTLRKVVDNINFTPDAMGDYFRKVKGLAPGANCELAQAIARRVADAKAVQDYRQYNPSH
ncbi:hypothetical protein JHL21_04310 [Devosia sp. WQ 349]|uniref:hypothetical protein n=1 Tax=Devosia sp. WQ 349K1 TaxID=2800329 RepID=UPI001904AC9E|nr:hypothetical protein [Devosia sp. WQ 349K1]MBK1793714.1 hypothetical protein [Devosia sp. WQ 349K1]